MPEHLRALVVIAVVAVITFWLAKRPCCEGFIDEKDFLIRRNAWFVMTLTAFASHNFWLFVLVASCTVAWLAARDPQPLAMYFTIVLALPPYATSGVPGLGIVNYLFELDPLRLLALVILLPLALKFLGESAQGRPTPRSIDMLLMAYIVLQFALQATVVNVTVMMRIVLYLLIDIWLPYYVASRALRRMQDFRAVMIGMVLGLLVMSMLAVFESVRGWLLYEGLRTALGLPPAGITYILRGDSQLRANVSAGNSIVLGYLIMVGLGFMVFLAPRVKDPRWRWLCIATLLAGLIASLSRGPWVGTAAMLVVAMGFGPGAGRRLLRLCGYGVLALALILITPAGDKVIDMLPFVGTVDNVNVIYRERLFEISMIVMWQNPIFGTYDYILNPLLEEMRQGQGIIDIVNSYIAIALGFGLVGLTLFVAPFIVVLIQCVLRHRRVAAKDAEADRLGRALVGTLAGVLLTIATVSSIGAIATVYYLLLGMCAAYARGLEAAPKAAAGEAAGARPRRNTRVFADSRVVR